MRKLWERSERQCSKRGLWGVAELGVGGGDREGFCLWVALLYFFVLRFTRCSKSVRSLPEEALSHRPLNSDHSDHKADRRAHGGLGARASGNGVFRLSLLGCARGVPSLPVSPERSKNEQGQGAPPHFLGGGSGGTDGRGSQRRPGHDGSPESNVPPFQSVLTP